MTDSTQYCSEIQDLNRGHDFLCHLLSVNRVAMFDSLDASLAFAVDWLKCLEGDWTAAPIHTPLTSSFFGTDFSTLLIEAKAIFSQYDETKSGKFYRNWGMEEREIEKNR